MLIRYTIPLILLYLSTLTLQAQERPTIDSLKVMVAGAEHDTTLCHIYLNWGEQVYLSDPDTALILWQSAVRIAESNLENPKDNLVKTTFLSYLANMLNNIGYIYINQGNITEGIEYYHRSLKIDEGLGNEEGAAIALSNIGTVFLDQGDTDNGLQYLLRSLEIQERIENRKGAAISLSNIGYVYSIQGDIEKGLESFHRSLDIMEELKDKKGMSSCLNNIGSMYDNKGDKERAIKYYKRSQVLREEIGDIQGLAIALNNIGGIYLDMEDIKIAKDYLQRSMEMAEDLGNPKMMSHTAGLLSKIAKKEGNYLEALKMYELNIKMRDSINNEETQKATIRQQTKYEFEKAALVKEQEEKEVRRKTKEERQRRNNLQYSVILLGLLVLGALILGLGKLSLPDRITEGLIFFSFLILFEFLLVLADPYIESWSGGAPGIKLMFNAGIAALIFPLHAFFESTIKARLAK